MGDRVSISFRKKEETYGGPTEAKTTLEESPALFHHWGGTEFPKMAFDWLKMIKTEIKDLKGSDPFTRLEPRNLKVQLRGTLAQEKMAPYKTFRKGIFKDHNQWMTHSIYLGKDSQDGDNSDNGHYTIDVDTGKLYNDKGESIA